MGILYDIEAKKWADTEKGEKLKAKANKFINDTDGPVQLILESGQTCNIGKTHKRLDKAKGEPFVMVFQQGLQQLILDGQLDSEEKAVLFTLSQFLTYDGRIEVPNEHGQVRPLIQQDLYRLMGWSRNSKATMGKVLKSLESKGLIIRVKDGRSTAIELDPRHFFVGRMRARDTRTKVYCEKIAEVAKESA